MPVPSHNQESKPLQDIINNHFASPLPPLHQFASLLPTPHQSASQSLTYPTYALISLPSIPPPQNQPTCPPHPLQQPACSPPHQLSYLVPCSQTAFRWSGYARLPCMPHPCIHFIHTYPTHFLPLIPFKPCMSCPTPLTNHTHPTRTHH